MAKKRSARRSGSKAAHDLSPKSGQKIKGGGPLDTNVVSLAPAVDLTAQVAIAMQWENQVSSSVSNVLKTRHDTAKNSISNVR